MDVKKYSALGPSCLPFKTEREVKDYLKQLLINKRHGYSVAINAEKIRIYNKDNKVKELINNSVLPVVDGSGALLALRLLHGLRCIRVDTPRLALETANESRLKVYLLGASEESNLRAGECIKKKYPELILAGRKNGYFISDSEVIEEIKKLQPDIIITAMGSPRQEIFAKNADKETQHGIYIGSGGAVDILAGKVKRAPKFFQDNHLEWFYRLAKQPSRIRRQIKLPLFLFKLVLYWIVSFFKKR